MAFKLVSGAGSVNEPAFISVAASGVIHAGDAVDLLRQGTGGAVVGPSTNSSKQTMIFGVGLDYAQGASDTFVRIVPFTRDQVWEVDCANAATTAQVGIRHALSASRGYIHNTATDESDSDGVFLALAMTGSTSGSGKLIGIFQGYIGQLIPVTDTTFLQ